MGPDPTADKNTSYFAWYFSTERAKRKHFITMSEFLYKAKQEPGIIKREREREVEKEVVQSNIYDAIKQILVYDAMKQ